MEEFKFCVISCQSGEVFAQFGKSSYAEVFCEALFQIGIGSYVYDSQKKYTVCEYEI
jgi:hypothetical protein